MKPTELKDLVTAILAVVMIAMAVGKLGSLQTFARHEAAKSVRGWPTHRFFTQSELKRF